MRSTSQRTTCSFSSRRNAERDHSAERIEAARTRFEQMQPADIERLERTLIAGLSASESSYDRESMRRAIAQYDGMAADDLRASLIEFLRTVVPVAEELGLQLAIHPDDPPWPLYGLPRIVSTADDLGKILAGCESPANGLTFCVGSLGAREDNDLLAMARSFAPRIHFFHLRQVRREPDGSFHEAEHLGGDSDMVGVIRAMLEKKETAAFRTRSIRLGDSDASRPWSSARRRYRQTGQCGLLLCRTAEGACGASRSHSRPAVCES